MYTEGHSAAILENPQPLGCRISECTDIEFLQTTIEKLWQIIDDIDTISDMVKGNNTAYRDLVEKVQRRRWETNILCDGYNLYCKKENND